MQRQHITWTRFEQCNQGQTESAFENMCRMLFNYDFFDNKALFHSSPQNPGIEIEPILEPNSQKRISFQSKYFDKNVDYRKIKHSAETTIKNYKGSIDVVYLYCNKDVSLDSNTYSETVALLATEGIDLIPITNAEILNRIITKNYTVIASYYFANDTIHKDWLDRHLVDNLSNLEPRFNRDFNVKIEIENQLDLFCRTAESIKRVNAKKINAVQKIKELRRYLNQYEDFINELIERIENIPDVEYDTFFECMKWRAEIETSHTESFSRFKANLEDKERILNSGEEKNIEKKDSLHAEIRYMHKFIIVFRTLEFDATEQKLINNKLLIIEGEAGIGKSQLLGNAAYEHSKQGEFSLLLLGQYFLTDMPLEQQILEHLGIRNEFEEFLQILEGVGVENGKCVVIFIDAINECANKDVWMNGLIQLSNRIDMFTHVRLVLSVRTGYRKMLFNTSFDKKIENGEIALLSHAGFKEDPIDAMMKFFDYYQITFSAADFLQYELINPLLLTLYCKTREKHPDSLFAIFDEYLEMVDAEAKRAVSIESVDILLRDFTRAVVNKFLEDGGQSISRTELLNLRFWNQNGLQGSKLNYIASLARNGFISCMPSFAEDNTECYYFAYNKLADYYSAKYILDMYSNKGDLRQYLIHSLLKIENGQIQNHSNKDVFMVLCGLYPSKFNEECIDIIDCINDEYDLRWLKDEYISTYSWRSNKTVNVEYFIDYINKNSIRPEKVWNLLISVSTKTDNPLNANLLHRILKQMPLIKRDNTWTIYINYLPYEERVQYLVKLFQEGKTLVGITHEERMLLSILFCWLLTASNRFLRDNASEALIEIIKEDFSLCHQLLQLFYDVDDPYVVQRLYGIVFGACMKRYQPFEKEYANLASFVYDNVFNQKQVYPDILLRDYARLIIERYLYEFPHSAMDMDVDKIRPPYKSKDIPKVPMEKYYDSSHGNSSLNKIDMSMRPNINGGYGDFGRYVFQSALGKFKGIDIENLYHYAMQFIRDELKFSDDYYYDNYMRVHGRHTQRKVERIGKKYQWIAFYNILARVSDHHKIKIWSDSDQRDNYQNYEGAWEPYVRDFDPTLNNHFLVSPDAPELKVPNSLDVAWASVESLDKKLAQEWTETKDEFFENHGTKLEIMDSKGNAWIMLTEYAELQNMEDIYGSFYPKYGAQEVWAMSRSYVVKSIDFSLFKEKLSFAHFWGGWFPEGERVYRLYNREYIWSPGYKSIMDDCWVDVEIDSGEKRTITYKGPDITFDEDGGIIRLDEVEYTREETIELNIGKVMPTYIHFLWEEEYDASQEEATSYVMPNKEIIESLHLEQKKYDGYFYSNNGDLVAFDASLLNSLIKGLVIRKDYLLDYLDKNDLNLFWTCLGEKQIFLGGQNKVWSEWSGFYYLDNEEIIGSMSLKDSNKSIE